MNKSLLLKALTLYLVLIFIPIIIYLFFPNILNVKKTVQNTITENKYKDLYDLNGIKFKKFNEVINNSRRVRATVKNINNNIIEVTDDNGETRNISTNEFTVFICKNIKEKEIDLHVINDQTQNDTIEKTIIKPWDVYMNFNDKEQNSKIAYISSSIALSEKIKMIDNSKIILYGLSSDESNEIIWINIFKEDCGPLSY